MLDDTEQMSLMPLLPRNASNSAPTKQVPLSITMVSGNPNLANVVLNSSTTAFDVQVDVQRAPIHLEWASIKAHFNRVSLVQV